MNILVINSGSSSLKYKVFDMPSQRVIKKGALWHIGEPNSRLKNHAEGIRLILKKLKPVQCVGHRVVHGGECFKKPVIINKGVIQKIKRVCSLAPLHNPANLAGITILNQLLKEIRQVAVFDTAFHQTLPDYAHTYGLPYAYYKKFGVRKYGFHGTSHEYVAQEAAKILNKPLKKLKLITCHLGNGCSITAVKAGVSVDTSMGFTPLEGLVMGTRCGDIDPALVSYLGKKLCLNPDGIDDILNKQSGLKGVSGISNDMRLLIKKAAAGNKRARLAIDIFAYRIKKYIGAYTAVMLGCDALVFTGGIGENQPKIRRLISSGLFSHLKKAPKILVIPTDEELLIARSTYRLLNKN